MKEEENNIKNKIFKDGQQKALFHVGAYFRLGLERMA